MEDLVNKITTAELEIMQVLWQAEEPLTYSQIYLAVGHNTRQTIQTLITRLVNKGALAQEKREVYYYSVQISKQDYGVAKAKELMARVYAGSARDLVAALFQENALTEQDMEEITRLWQEVRKNE